MLEEVKSLVIQNSSYMYKLQYLLYYCIAHKNKKIKIMQLKSHFLLKVLMAISVLVMSYWIEFVRCCYQNRNSGADRWADLHVIYLLKSGTFIFMYTNVETWAVASFFLPVDEQVNGCSVLWILAVRWELK